MTRQAQPDARTALATRRENGNGNQAVKTLKDEIVKMQAEYQLAMPKGAEATQLIRDAVTAIRTTRHLEECERNSVLGSLMTCAQLGLRPGVLGHAWLLPFWTSKLRKDGDRWISGYKAQLVIGYQGYIELAHRSGKVSSLIARVVYEGDEFDVDYGLDERLIHKPNMAEDRGKPVAYYAIAKFVNGGHAFVVMSQREMENYREQYATARDRNRKVFGPWVDNFEGMALKTCVRQLAKYMPKSTEMAQAIAVDDGVRVDLNPNVDAAEVTDFIDGEVADEPTESAGDQQSGDKQDWPDTANIPGTGQQGGQA